MAPIILFIKSKFLSFYSLLPAQLTADISKGPPLGCSVPTSQAAGGVTGVETRGCQSPVLLCDPLEASQRGEKSVHVYRWYALV